MNTKDIERLLDKIEASAPMDIAGRSKYIHDLRTALQTHPMDAEHWAELHRLRAERGPSDDGLETWRDAAIAERTRRVAAEKSLKSKDREDAERWRYVLRNLFKAIDHLMWARRTHSASWEEAANKTIDLARRTEEED